ncbi:unnamed protein product [Rotaria sordida]|uniref:Uncharacterized protein n=1 Tax=Rotaria sordida TaxID=392033 RepID=A0A819GVD5_9BILA|nr:unnamed protein product [Rotaria sordida]
MMSTISCGGKRSSEENVGSPNKRKHKQSKHGLTVPYSVYSAKEQECLVLQAQVATFKQEWMPRPRHPKVIEYFVEITNVLTGRGDDDEEEEDMETVSNSILTSLNMTQDQLKSCHGKTATSTARHIMKYKYPYSEPNFKFSEIDQ